MIYSSTSDAMYYLNDKILQWQARGNSNLHNCLIENSALNSTLPHKFLIT